MKNDEILDKNYKYFLEHSEELCKKYLNKFVIIYNENICGAYDTFEEAIEKATKSYEVGTFLIQECVKDINKPTQIFHSRVM